MTHSRRRGFLGVEYLREIGALAGLVALVLVVVTALLQPTSSQATTADGGLLTPIYSIGFNRDQDSLWVNQLFEGVTEYSVTSGEVSYEWPISSRQLSNVVRGGSDFMTIAIADSSGQVLILHDEQVHTRYFEPGASRAVADIDVSEDGRHVFAIYPEGELLQWSWNGETFDLRRHRLTDCVDRISASPDGKWLLMATSENALQILDLATREVIRHPELPQERWSQLAWSPDSRNFAVGSDDGLVRMFDAQSRALIWSARADQLAPASLTFSADGRQIAAGGFDKCVRVWNASSGRFLAEMPGHDGPIRALAFDSQNRWLASADLNGHVMIWSAEDYGLVRKLR